MHKHLFIPCLCKKNIHTYVKRTRLMLTYHILKFLFCKINIYCEVKVTIVIFELLLDTISLIEYDK